MSSHTLLINTPATPTPMPVTPSLLEQQAATESNVRSYPRRIPIAIAKAQGCIVTDTTGRSYYDCLAGAGSLALGHNHPAVIQAMQQVFNQGLPLHTLDLTTPIKQQFINDVLASLPDYFDPTSVVQFCGPTGADAVEAAIKLAKLITGRDTLLSFQGGYHGMSHGALAVTGNLQAKSHIPGLMPNVQFLPYPYAYRCPFGLGGEACWQTSIHYLEQLLADPESGVKPPAAVIVEIIQGEGGVIPAPQAWLQRLRNVTRQHDILLIIDEVQTGIGRTGDLLACEFAQIAPDILILSKAIGGSLPLSLLVFPKQYDAWSPGAHSGTFRGNQLAMAAGSATLRTLRETELLAQVKKMGQRLTAHLQTIQAQSDCIGDVRGRGLMLGVEIIDSQQAPDQIGSYPVNPQRARAIQQQCLQRGLIIEIGGRFGSTLRFLPPLIIQPQEIDDIAQIFQQAVHA